MNATLPWLAPAVMEEIVGAFGTVRGVLARMFEVFPFPTTFTARNAT